MTKSYVVTLSRVVREYQRVTVVAWNMEDAKREARKVARGDRDPRDDVGEYGGPDNWCDSTYGKIRTEGVEEYEP